MKTKANCLAVALVAMAAFGLTMPLLAEGGITTFDDLQSAVTSASAGATIEIAGDMEYDRPLVVGKAITIQSPAGSKFRIRRASGYTSGMFLNESTAILTLKNIIIDGGKEFGSMSGNMVYISASFNAGLTLGDGAEIVNADLVPAGDDKHNHAIYNAYGQLKMEAGSVISNIVGRSHGAAVLLGYGAYTANSYFAMKGGLITDCRDVNTRTPAKAYGGAVYIWGGLMVLGNGVITNNTSQNSVGGMYVHNGYLRVDKGFGDITGNKGPVCNNVFCHTNNSVWLNSDYTCGRLGILPDIEALGANSNRCVTAQAGGTETLVWSGNVFWDSDPLRIIDGDSYQKKYIPSWTRKKIEVFDGTFSYAGYASGRYEPFRSKLSNLHTDCALVLYDDFIMTNALSLATDQHLTVKSGDGEPAHELRLPDDYTNRLFLVDRPNSRLRLENVVLNGNKDHGGAVPPAKENCGLVRCGANGTVELASGSVISNSLSVNGAAAGIAVAGTNSVVRMYDGAVICDCEARWGVGVLVGIDGIGSDTLDPLFEMSGGLITRCVSRDRAVGYGAAVYIWSGRLEMSGGKITGNQSLGDTATAAAGVHTENGNSVLKLSGTAEIWGNTGGSPDLYLKALKKAVFSGDFRGKVGVSVDANNRYLDIQRATGASGAWSFFIATNDDSTNAKQWGYCNTSQNRVSFSNQLKGTVDGIGFVQSDDLALRLTDSEDLSTPAKRAKLPHVLTGDALTTAITQTLVFDPAEMAASQTTPLMLYDLSNYEGATGALSFTTPQSGKLRWSVADRTVGEARGIYLTRELYGMVLLLK